MRMGGKGRKGKEDHSLALIPVYVRVVRQRHIGVHGREDDGHGEQDQTDAAAAPSQVQAVTASESTFDCEELGSPLYPPAKN